MIRTATGFCAGLLLHCVLHCYPASARVWYVNQNTVTRPDDGSSFDHGFRRIQEALTVAQQGDEVWVARGEYAESLTMTPSVEMYGGFAGTETTRQQRNWIFHPTVVIGGATSILITCYVRGSVVDGFTLRDQAVPAGIFIDNGGTLTVANCVIRTDSGSAVRVDHGVVEIHHNLIVNSHSGVVVNPTSEEVGAATLSNNVISGNNAGIIVADGSATLANNTITANTDGIAIVRGAVRLTNNVVAFNTTSGMSINHADGGMSLTCNNVFGNGANYLGLPDSTGMNGNISADPKLASLFRDVRLQPDSPCRDAGDMNGAMGVIDMEGQPRLQGARVDIGADESDGLTHSATPGIWFVSETGNDSSPGASWSTARRTIQGALRVALGGDQVWVALPSDFDALKLPAGVELFGGFSGTETSPTQRIAAKRTVLEGDNLGETGVSCTLTGHFLDGFAIQRYGIGVDCSPGKTVLRNMVISGNDRGVRVASGTLDLTGSVIENNTGLGVYIRSSPLKPSFLTGNLFRANQQGGVWVEGSMVILSRNTFTGGTSGVTLHSASDVSVRDNLFAGNAVCGVSINTNSLAWLVNNTLAANGDGVIVDGTVEAHLVNNIIAFNSAAGVRKVGSTANLTLFRDDVFGNTPNYFGSVGSTANDISLDPLFVNRPGFDFHLTAGSPCRDAGADNYVQLGDLDLDGRARLLGSHVDIGAYEFVPPGFTLSDVIAGLHIAGGRAASTPTDLARLNVEQPGLSAITLADAARIARKVAGLDPNP